MQSDKTALTNGLLFGSDEGFSSSLKNLTRDAGVTHLVAASGANLRFVESLWKGLFWLFGTRFVQYTSVLGVIGYWLLAEQSGSLWRASGMWVITWLGRLKGKKIPLWYSLGGILLFTTFGYQQYLTPGFWLSVLAILGVFFSQKILSGEKKRVLFPQAHFWSNSVALSLGEGSVIFGMVTMWLWTQYQVFQPIGIFSTAALNLLVDPLVWLGIGLRFSLEGNHWLDPVFSLLGVLQEVVYQLFMHLLTVCAGAASTFSSPILMTPVCALVFIYTLHWQRRRKRQAQWRRLSV